MLTNMGKPAYMVEQVIMLGLGATEKNAKVTAKKNSSKREKILKIFSAILIGMFTGKYSFASFKALLRSVLVSGKIRDHYESYPEDPGALRDWAEKADHLWQKAGARMK